ncbi:cell division protein ZapE [Glutamicibacter creatinolyticus]|uniref:cell division protein ZapE n=1 Tax=Glutamicibacter creatinolyticus TaxID=162496 RepID=UPI0031E0933E
MHASEAPIALGRISCTERQQMLTHFLERQAITPDESQMELMGALSRLLDPGANETAPTGCYIYGPTGRGKTMILNALMQTLNPASSARMHFHEFFDAVSRADASETGPKGSIFMRGLQRELSGLEVLCFDEFHCVEPGDAMFMARLVGYCQEHRIRLITTSNYAPEFLLDDPYFHHLIEPTIAVVRSSFLVHELDHRLDYRTVPTTASAAGGYRAGSLNVGATPPAPTTPRTTLRAGYDEIEPVYMQGTGLRTSFDQLCRTRRNTRDYLEMSRRFEHWIITDIPAVADMPMDEQRRFANLIDVLYDQNREVHLYCADNLQRLGQALQGIERDRLLSRLAQLPVSAAAGHRKY